MKTKLELIGAMALLAAMPGSEALAQAAAGMQGQAAVNPSDYKWLPRNPFAGGQGLSLGDMSQAGSTGGSQVRVIVDHLRPAPVGDLSDDIVLVPGSPFLVSVGSNPGNLELLLDAGIVPAEGLRVLTLAPLGEQGDDVSIWFQTEHVIICLAGRDASTGIEPGDSVALVGPGASGGVLGQGAALVAGDLSHDLSGDAMGSDDRSSGSSDGDRGDRRAFDPASVSGAGASAAKGQAAP